MLYLGPNSKRFLGSFLMVLHRVRHIWVGTVGASIIHLAISGISWNTCLWSLSFIHAKVSNHVTTGVSVGDSLHWSIHSILINGVSKTNSWNCVNIKELEIVCICITVELIA